MHNASDTWQCSKCRAPVESSFEVCWRCGAGRDGELDPEFNAEVVLVQDESVCTGCGYALRGLRSDCCPECGLPFDPEAVDTAKTGPGPPPTSPAQRRKWMVLTTVAWVGLLTLGIIAANVDASRAWWERHLTLGLIICIIASFACPLRWFSLILRPLEPVE